MILLIVLLGALGATLYIFYSQLSADPIAFIPLPRNETPIETKPIDYSQSQQFYPNMRFQHSKISYGFEPGCDSKKQTTTVEALAEISEKTMLVFYPSSTPEIIITCTELAPQPKVERHFVAGEGGPTEIINATQFSVIKQGKISLYRDEKCSKPHIAVHELLHALGFDHNADPHSILYPTLDCSQEIDQYLVDRLNELYAIPSKPDLAITELSALKTGRLVNFTIEVTNEGLIDAASVSMGLYGDGKLIRSFDFDNVPVGTRKTLTVSDLTIGRSVEKLKFVIDPNNNIDELNRENNLEELLISATD